VTKAGNWRESAARSGSLSHGTNVHRRAGRTLACRRKSFRPPARIRC
jgi:hypothetical protein